MSDDRYFDVIVEEIPSARYQRARALVLLGKYKEALVDLEACSVLLEAGAIEQSTYFILYYLFFSFCVIFSFVYLHIDCFSFSF